MDKVLEWCEENGWIDPHVFNGQWWGWCGVNAVMPSPLPKYSPIRDKALSNPIAPTPNFKDYNSAARFYRHLWGVSKLSPEQVAIAKSALVQKLPGGPQWKINPSLKSYETG